MRTAEPLRGSSASLRRASKRSSIGLDSSLATSSRRCRRAANFFTSRRFRSLFSTALFFAINGLQFSASELLRSLPEREVERTQQGARFRVGPGRRADDDVEAQHGLGLVVVDLGENDVFLDAQGIVAATVEG